MKGKESIEEGKRKDKPVKLIRDVFRVCVYLTCIHAISSSEAEDGRKMRQEEEWVSLDEDVETQTGNGRLVPSSYLIMYRLCGASFRLGFCTA